MKKALLLPLLVMLSACAFEPMPDPIQLNYADMERIYLNTKELRIVDRSQDTPKWDPYVGHEFAPTLTDAIYRLAGDRLQAVGKKGRAKLIIKDANVIEQTIESSSDFDSLFTREQALKYIGRVEVSLEAQSPRGALSVATAHAVHSVTLPEDPSGAEKYRAYTKLLNNLIAGLNRHLETAIKQHMRRFLVRKPPNFIPPTQPVNAQ